MSRSDSLEEFPADLSPLLEPRGVVVVGASTNPDKLGFAMATSLASFPGEVRLVNTRPSPGMHPSITEAAATSDSLDLAVLCVPAQHTATALRESAGAGIRAALVCSGGFAEAGGAGIGYADDVRLAVTETGIRLLGPNTSGFFVPSESLFASFVPGVRQFGAGSVAVVAASGGINHVLSFRLENEGAGVSIGIGVGAGQDVAAPELLNYLASHDQTRAVILHLETVDDGPALIAAVRRVTAVKPVIALVVGRNDVSAFAQSHTGSLATSWRTTRAALRQAGAVLVQDEGEAVAVATALAARRARPAAALGIGLITAQAGPGLIVADALGDTAALPELATATRERLAELLPPMTFQANPVDTGRPGETFTSVVAAVAGDPVIGILGVYAIAEAVVDLVSDVIESGVTAEIPTVIGIDGPADDVARVQRQGRALGIPVVQGPTNLARALAAIAEDARGARRPAVVANERDMDIGIEGCEEWDEARGKDLLGRLGISTPLRRRCADREAARRAVVELEGPLAVKLLDASVLHKTEMGGVILNVSSREEMEEALDRLESVGATEFLVESMAGPGIDLIVGARRDPVFGPIVALGLGGVAAEVIADVAIRVAPLSPEEASSMVDDLAGRALLLGHRGAASVDLAELGRIVSRIGDLVADDVVAEIEINPLRSTDGGIVALDAVVLPIYKDVKVLQ